MYYNKYLKYKQKYLNLINLNLDKKKENIMIGGYIPDSLIGYEMVLSASQVLKYNINCGLNLSYNIPNGNATSIVEMIKNQSGNPNNFNYTAAVYSGDPAYCCAKKFDYSYKCGNVTKSGTVNAGQNINFNCTTEMSKCNFFLTLQDDGNMCIYRGTGPQDSKGSVWCSNTNGKQQSANPAWVATLGDTRKNYMSNGWW